MSSFEDDGDRRGFQSSPTENVRFGQPMEAVDQVLDRFIEVVGEGMAGCVIDGSVGDNAALLLVDRDDGAYHLGVNKGWADHLEEAIPVLQDATDMEPLPLFQRLPGRNINARVDEHHNFHGEHAVRSVQDQAFLRLRNDTGLLGDDEREKPRFRNNVGAGQSLLEGGNLGVVLERLGQAEEGFVPGIDPHPLQAIEQMALIGLLHRAEKGFRRLLHR